ncbi:DUF2383 domain-containing protein [Paenibacillus chartarius]|uniref:DUF2383 domain-containing protein n=1 Tax=Paenibacillus chartarius TaxID=747481 RepID=A0ABV6DM68_9BACL
MTDSAQQLAKFLEGQYMGIHAYDHFIQNMDDAYLKQELQHIQQDLKSQASRVAARIQELGGNPPDNLGIGGQIQEWVSELKGFPASPEGILRMALKGEDKYGIHRAHEEIHGKLDEQSAALIDDVFKRSKAHVDKLQLLLEHLSAAERL